MTCISAMQSVIDCKICVAISTQDCVKATALLRGLCRGHQFRSIMCSFIRLVQAAVDGRQVFARDG
jgi:hypothetical protein